MNRWMKQNENNTRGYETSVSFEKRCITLHSAQKDIIFTSAPTVYAGASCKKVMWGQPLPSPLFRPPLLEQPPSQSSPPWSFSRTVPQSAKTFLFNRFCSAYSGLLLLGAAYKCSYLLAYLLTYLLTPSPSFPSPLPSPPFPFHSPSHSIWIHSVTRTIFPVLALKVMHGVILLSWFCELLTTFAILSEGPRASSASIARRLCIYGFAYMNKLGNRCMWKSQQWGCKRLTAELYLDIIIFVYVTVSLLAHEKKACCCWHMTYL